MIGVNHFSHTHWFSLSLLLIQPLARLGAEVTGIDPIPAAIDAAQSHAQTDPDISQLLKYHCCTAEELIKEESLRKFDCVIASEVVEHVSNVSLFINHLSQLVKVVISYHVMYI